MATDIGHPPMPDARSTSTSAMVDPPSKPCHKSFRRKYRKTMVKFEEKMRESTALFRDEQKILDITRRLIEQNDRILEMLLEANSYPQIPARLRYDLSAVGEATPMPDAAKILDDHTTAQRALDEAHHALRQGSITHKEFHALSAEILSCPSFAPSSSYKQLLTSVPHTTISPAPADTTTPYLTTSHEEDYHSGLDAFLSGTSTTPRPHSSKDFARLSPAEREKFFQLKFGASMYNWLRRERPEVFLQDGHHGTKDKDAAETQKPSTRKSRKSAASVKKEAEDEVEYDDDGVPLEPSSLPPPLTPRESGRGKRKRGDKDDDSGYRPKGGNSRPSKRRRETGEISRSVGSASRARKGGSNGTSAGASVGVDGSGGAGEAAS